VFADSANVIVPAGLGTTRAETDFGVSVDAGVGAPIQYVRSNNIMKKK
jgi:hypothetical protein